MKQRLVAVARAAGLLPLLDAMRFMRSKWASAEENARFRDAHSGFSPPPLWWMHDMYRHTSYARYWKTGADTAAALAKKIDAYAVAPEGAEGPRVADWGCGLARVLRHLPAHYQRTGFDYNAAAVHWCASYIDGATFHKNELRPPLPVESASFDVLYALSVFTHLSLRGHMDWIGDVERVLAPGGLLLAAFHMRPGPDQLLPGEQTKFDRGELVVRGGVKEGSRTYVAYHPERFLREQLLRGFDVLEVEPEFFGQALFVARKR